MVLNSCVYSVDSDDSSSDASSIDDVPMGNSPNSKVIQVRPSKAVDEMGRKEAKALRRLVHRVTFKPPPSALTTIRSLDLMTAFIGNTKNTQYFAVSCLGLVLWLLSVLVSFAFDGFEAFMKYGYAWATIKATEWGTFCLGTYYLVTRTMPWLRKGLYMLEDDGRYQQSLGKIGAALKKLQISVALFSVLAASIQYTVLRLDKADHVTFNHTTSSHVGHFLHVCRFMSGLHVVYAYSLFWFVPGCVMLMTGHSMIEYQERIRSRLRKKKNQITFREAVISYDERVKFAKKSSNACVVLLTLLLVLTLASVIVNAYIYLYKNRYHVYIWHALMPVALAIYPMCTAAWVTEQYHGYFVTVVKAWVERPESDSESESEPERGTKNPDAPSSKTKPAPGDSRPPAGLRIHMPSTGHVTVGEQSESESRMNLRRVFMGSARAVGRWQRQRKLPPFNFEKYISYLNNLGPETGFKISVITVTWELVSATLFLIISVVALFLQETIFGADKPSATAVTTTMASTASAINSTISTLLAQNSTAR